MSLSFQVTALMFSFSYSFHFQTFSSILFSSSTSNGLLNDRVSRFTRKRLMSGIASRTRKEIKTVDFQSAIHFSLPSGA